METLGIIFLAIVAPLWIIMHYATQARAKRGLSTEDEQMLGELWDSAKRMEERINTLEKILDNDTASWRRERHEHPY